MDSTDRDAVATTAPADMSRKRNNKTMMRSLEEVGLIMGGISKQAVAKIEMKAINKLRQRFHEQGLITGEDLEALLQKIAKK